jgi:hypothetical protein
LRTVVGFTPSCFADVFVVALSFAERLLRDLKVGARSTIFIERCAKAGAKSDDHFDTGSSNDCEALHVRVAGHGLLCGCRQRAWIAQRACESWLSNWR